MLDADFVDIIMKIAAGKSGKDLFLEKSKMKSLLLDYTKSEFKKETSLLLAILSTDSVEYINRAENLADCKQYLVKRLEDDYSISQQKSAEMLDLLFYVLRGVKMQSQSQQTAPNNMVSINSGTFMMGSPANEPERSGYETQHQVTVSGFYMGMYEVTQKDYQEVMWTNPSNYRGDNLPVEQVSWFDVVNYCNRRSQLESLTSAYTINGDNVTWDRKATGYRLPTEAEWEYACRAGTTTPFSTGNNITTDQANYDGSSPYNNNGKGIYRKRTTEVGSFKPNDWGLYDMHGNVWEWCWDWYGHWYERCLNGEQTDPIGAESGTQRVERGGGWEIDGEFLRSAARFKNKPSYKFSGLGFRVVRS